MSRSAATASQSSCCAGAASTAAAFTCGRQWQGGRVDAECRKASMSTRQKWTRAGGRQRRRQRAATSPAAVPYLRQLRGTHLLPRRRTCCLAASRPGSMPWAEASQRGSARLGAPGDAGGRHSLQNTSRRVGSRWHRERPDQFRRRRTHMCAPARTRPEPAAWFPNVTGGKRAVLGAGWALVLADHPLPRCLLPQNFALCSPLAAVYSATRVQQLPP